MEQVPLSSSFSLHSQDIIESPLQKSDITNNGTSSFIILIFTSLTAISLHTFVIALKFLPSTIEVKSLVLLWVEPWLDICPPCQRYDSMKFCANFCKFGTSLIGSKRNTAYSKPFKIYYLLFKSVLSNKTIEQTTLTNIMMQ